MTAKQTSAFPQAKATCSNWNAASRKRDLSMKNLQPVAFSFLLIDSEITCRWERKKGNGATCSQKWNSSEALDGKGVRVESNNWRAAVVKSTGCIWRCHIPEQRVCRWGARLSSVQHQVLPAAARDTHWRCTELCFRSSLSILEQRVRHKGTNHLILHKENPRLVWDSITLCVVENTAHKVVLIIFNYQILRYFPLLQNCQICLQLSVAATPRKIRNKIKTCLQKAVTVYHTAQEVVLFENSCTKMRADFWTSLHWSNSSIRNQMQRMGCGMHVYKTPSGMLCIHPMTRLQVSELLSGVDLSYLATDAPNSSFF